eukprot:scaffold6275_cov75-Skeletonema_dohrnii-CCMP3373.AAC.2
MVREKIEQSQAAEASDSRELEDTLSLLDEYLARERKLRSADRTMQIQDEVQTKFKVDGCANKAWGEEEALRGCANIVQNKTFCRHGADETVQH